ncbi:MAG: hypothetical protein H7Y30_18080 [Pyrinomonadaceae bacterium]|nr:hypothetical protein [Pyrinomonadaceae bacterium]
MVSLKSMAKGERATHVPTAMLPREVSEHAQIAISFRAINSKSRASEDFYKMKIFCSRMAKRMKDAPALAFCKPACAGAV